MKSHRIYLFGLVVSCMAIYAIGCAKEDRMRIQAKPGASTFITEAGKIDFDEKLEKTVLVLSHNSRLNRADELEVLISLTARTSRGAEVRVTTDFYDLLGHRLESVGPTEHTLDTDRAEQLQFRASKPQARRYLVYIRPHATEKRGWWGRGDQVKNELQR